MASAKRRKDFLGHETTMTGRNRIILITFVVLYLSVAMAVGSFSNRMELIKANLEDLSDGLYGTKVNYSEPHINATYVSTTTFDAKGMSHLYNTTTIVIDFIQKKEAYPEGLLSVRGGNIEVNAAEWRVILGHYVGVVTVAVLALLFAIALPIVGFCFCCCRCAGACGARSQPFDKKHDRCKKMMLATLLICFVTLFMFGVVCTFVTNEQMHEATHDLPASGERSLKDVRTFLNTTTRHVDHLLITNYNELRESLTTTINRSGAIVSEALGKFSRAVSVTKLNSMVGSLGAVRGNLTLVRNVTQTLRTKASLLDFGLRNIKNKLLQTLKDCTDRQCREINEKNKIGQLKADIEFNLLPDVTELLDNVSLLINGNIQAEVEQGQKKFQDIKNSIEKSVTKQLPTLKKAITEASEEVSQFSRKMNERSASADQALQQQGSAAIQRSRHYIQQYSVYRWYLGLATACALLLVLACMAMGLLCGICGKRPDGYGDDCCNKGAGSKFLMLKSSVSRTPVQRVRPIAYSEEHLHQPPAGAGKHLLYSHRFGVALMFLLGCVLTVVMLVHFIVGVVAQRGLCDPLQNPQEDRLFSLLEELVDVNRLLYKREKNDSFDLSYMINSCHQNKTVYEAFRLDKMVNIDEIQRNTEYRIQQKIDDVTQHIEFTSQNVVILNHTAKQKLKQLANSGLSDFPFDKFTDVLVANMTTIDLHHLAEQLQNTSDRNYARPGFRNVSLALQDCAFQLRTLQTDLVDVMIEEARRLNDTAIYLRDGLKFNHESFHDAVDKLVIETEEAEVFLRTTGRATLKNLTETFAGSIGDMVKSYMVRVVEGSEHRVGRCAPLSNVYNATLTATCQRILLPLNGFWVAIVWCLLLFVPTIVLSVKLATLYQKSDPYPGPLVEAEYMYDAYTDRDNIPLANAYHSEKPQPKGGGKRRGGGGGGGVSGGAGSGTGVVAGVAGPSRAPQEVAPTGTAPPLAADSHDPRRYNDMAPKHWEEGPPRYHGPTEYERPPPYYYPGPVDGQ